MESKVLVPNISSFIECNINVELNTTDIAEEILKNTNSPTSERDEPSEDSYTTSGGGSSTTYDKGKHSVVNKTPEAYLPLRQPRQLPHPKRYSVLSSVSCISQLYNKSLLSIPRPI